MNLWSVVERRPTGDVPFSVAFWAWGSDEAVAAFWERWISEGGHEAGEVEIYVSRIETDYEPVSESPCHEWRDRVLRDAFWFYECDDSCDTCGKYEMDGKFPVCENCEQCSECGCKCSEVDD